MSIEEIGAASEVLYHAGKIIFFSLILYICAHEFLLELIKHGNVQWFLLALISMVLSLALGDFVSIFEVIWK